MKPGKALLPVILGLALVAPGRAADRPTDPKRTATRDVCVADVNAGFPLNFFIFRDVAPLSLNQPVSLTGMYFVRTRLPAPVHGSAVLVSDGSVRIGFFVHSTAVPTAEPNDFTIAGKTDANFAGVVSYDNDGDFRPNGTLDLRVMDCSTVVIA